MGSSVAVLNQLGSDDPSNYDLSFMFTKRCNLHCSFCMYNSGPDVTDALDLDKLETWLWTVDPNCIAFLGVYGGEPSEDPRGFGRCLVMAKRIIGPRPCFAISNGSWSTDLHKAGTFIEWCRQHQLFLVVSGTPEHRKFQDRAYLEYLKDENPGAIRLKPLEENFHAMGRLEGKMPFSCSQKCMSWDRALRIAVQPDGSIIFQNCDGVYPVVGSIDEPFDITHRRVQRARREGFGSVCQHYQVEREHEQEAAA